MTSRSVAAPGVTRRAFREEVFCRTSSRRSSPSSVGVTALSDSLNADTSDPAGRHARDRCHPDRSRVRATRPAAAARTRLPGGLPAVIVPLERLLGHLNMHGSSRRFATTAGVSPAPSLPSIPLFVALAAVALFAVSIGASWWTRRRVLAGIRANWAKPRRRPRNLGSIAGITFRVCRYPRRGAR